ncbi:hypothetical protein WH47_12437, partial [Habropoda laboriosa]
VIRYGVTRCLHGPKSREFTILCASRAVKMPFYEATEHIRHRSSTIHCHSPMDRVRHCTGEMFHQRVSKDS